MKSCWMQSSGGGSRERCKIFMQCQNSESRSEVSKKVGRQIIMITNNLAQPNSLYVSDKVDYQY